VTHSGATVTATPEAGYNANLAAGASTTWGFHADYNGTSNPVPTITCAGPSQGSGSATLSGPLDPLGVNTAAWDTNFTDPAIASDLSAAHIGLIRYPGGSWADQYLWQPNTVNGSTQPVDFAQYSSQVDAITGGQKLVTINYGSDTPQHAAAWVSQSTTSGEGVNLWEIGNEEYGSWETDSHANPHTAASYASNALPYMQDMKAANPNAQICYDYAMDGNLAPGSGVSGFQNWNDTILSADAADINCADVHWYPINGTPTESVQSIMELIDNIPAAASEVDTALSTYDPNAYFIVGETNMSQTANAWNEEPVRCSRPRTPWSGCPSAPGASTGGTCTTMAAPAPTSACSRPRPAGSPRWTPRTRPTTATNWRPSSPSPEPRSAPCPSPRRTSTATTPTCPAGPTPSCWSTPTRPTPTR